MCSRTVSTEFRPSLPDRPCHSFGSAVRFTVLGKVHFLILNSTPPFGVGLDLGEARVIGPKKLHSLWDVRLESTTFATVDVAVGYPGADLNQARCFAFAVARGDFKCEVWTVDWGSSSSFCVSFDSALLPSELWDKHTLLQIMHTLDSYHFER